MTCRGSRPRSVGGAWEASWPKRYYNRSMPALPTAPPDYRQHLEIETPEHVVLDLEIAGIGSRALAAVLDMAILVGSGFALLIVLTILSGYGISVGRVGSVVMVLLGFAVWNGYFILFEGLR